MATHAWVNDWLAVGTHRACGEPGFELVIHIFRSDTPEQIRPDYCARVTREVHLRMDYRDGDEIDRSNLKNLTAFVELLKARKRKTLVHCHAGMCRSPTVAIYLLVMVDGMHPYDAHQLITRAIYEQRGGEVCNVVYRPFKQIVRLWEANQKLKHP